MAAEDVIKHAAEIIARHKAGPWWTAYTDAGRADLVRRARLPAVGVLNLRDAEPGGRGGPWTRHGHDIPGVTVAGAGRPRVIRCGGPGLCAQCADDAARWSEEGGGSG